MPRFTKIINFLCVTLITLQTRPGNSVFLDSVEKQFLSQFSNETSQAITHEISSFGTKLGSFSIKPLSEREKRSHAFKLISHHTPPREELIDEVFVDKMEIVGNSHNPTASLLFNLSNTRITTFLGQAALAHILVQPTNDVATLKKRQKALQTLLKKKELLSQLVHALTDIRDSQDALLSYWQEESPDNQTGLKLVYWPKALSFINKSPLILETGARLGQLQCMVTPGILLGSAYYTISKYNPYLNLHEKCALIAQGTSKIFSTIKSLPGREKAYAIACTSFGTAFFGYGFYKGISCEKFKQNIRNHLHERINGVAKTHRAMKKIAHLINRHPELAAAMPSLHDLVKATKGTNHSASFNKLKSLLESSTLNDSPSFFSLQGRALTAHTLMQEVKNEFAGALAAIGKLDAFIAIARTFKHHQSTPARFSFAQFMENETPCICAKGLWHPCLDANTVVTNDVEIGSTNACNAIITGPNTGGKTTIIKAILANLLLAQTFGICAGEMMFTPFTRLNCHMNLTDDLANGTSLFKAEVNHAKKLIDSIKSLAPHEFAFTVMDEAFRSTAPQQGEEASYQFASQLASFKNSCCFIATHYHKLVNLEKSLGTFANYHVGIILHDNGSFTRTFKLEQGPSTVNIALEILKEEGVLW